MRAHGVKAVAGRIQNQHNLNLKDNRRISMSQVVFFGILEWFSAFTAVIGSLLLALNNQYSRYGWIAFFMSNTTMIVFSFNMDLMGILLMNVVFMITTLLGINRWFFQKELSVITN